MPPGAAMSTGLSGAAATTAERCTAVLDEIERAVVGKRSALTLILTTVLMRRTCAHRRLARPGQDADRTVVRRRARTGLHPGAVHPRPAARRPARHDRLRHVLGPFRIPARADLHQPGAGRRDQPNAAQDPGGPAGGDGRRSGQHRRPHASVAVAVHRAGNRQSDRVRGHLPAAGGAAGPVRDPAAVGLSLGAGGGGHAAPHAWIAVPPYR